MCKHLQADSPFYELERFKAGASGVSRGMGCRGQKMYDF